MSASNTSIKHKLQQEALWRLINSDQFNALFFEKFTIIPQLAGNEWAIRECSYPGYVELFRRADSHEVCSRLTIAEIKKILCGKGLCFFEENPNLLELIVPERAQQILMELPPAQPPFSSETYSEDKPGFARFERIVSRSEQGLDAFRSDFFLDPEQVKRRNEERLRKFAEAVGLTDMKFL
ncbi:hypothetical protein [Legionella sp. CNM-4043-24]|uniref:hypothetical protein n=1 Tax=Legionella sp. CNM-4043-24 TaxID=3421646 RepID=UPI00403B312B